MIGTHETTRRRLLTLAAGVGSAALAGCSGVTGGENPVELDGEALRELVAEDAPDPSRTLPVDIDPAYLDESETRARELLASVPSEFTADQIPNGVIRHRLSDTREHATEVLARAEKASSSYERLSQLQHARSEARHVAAAWAAIDGDLTREDVLSEVGPLRESLREFRDRWQYLGVDPVRSVVVHAAIEDEVRHVAGTLASPSRRRDSTTALSVGELAERLEGARTSIADADHLYDQYTASLDGSQKLQPTFESARKMLVADIRAQTRDRFGEDAESVDPGSLVERDIEGTLAEYALDSLVDPLVYRGFDDDSRTDSLTSDLLTAHEQLTHHRALDALVSRIEDGETFAVESVDDVRQYRSEAVEALSAALSGDVSHLTRHRTTGLARQLSYADDRLTNVDDTVQVSGHEHTFAEYVVVATMATATPPVSDEVRETLKSA